MSTAGSQENLAELIDPATEDPLDYIQFAEREDRPGCFTPVGRAGNRRGTITIDCLGLDREDLLDIYTTYVEALDEKIADVLGAMATGGGANLAEAWHLLLRELNPRLPFLALKNDVIDQRIPETLRRLWGLELPRPHIKMTA